jgi:hypothetical protein
MALFEILFRHFPGMTEENQGRAQDNLCLDRNSNWKPLEYLSEALLLESACPVTVLWHRGMVMQMLLLYVQIYDELHRRT